MRTILRVFVAAAVLEAFAMEAVSSVDAAEREGARGVLSGFAAFTPRVV